MIIKRYGVHFVVGISIRIGGGRGTFLSILSLLLLLFNIITPIASVESQKGAITIQRCPIENQKGAIAIDIVHCTLLVLNGTSLNILIAPFWLTTDDIILITIIWLWF